MADGESSGPFVRAALLCEKVVKERGGVLSAARIFERVVAPAPGELKVDGYLLVMLAAGSATGNHELEVRSFRPSHAPLRDPYVTLFRLLPDPESGATFLLKLGFTTAETGVHWFEVRVDGKLVTRVPLKVIRGYETATSSRAKGRRTTVRLALDEE
jgi:hypothetical protein